MTEQIDYHWKPITDLPEDWIKLASQELVSLSALWKEQSKELRESDEINHFLEALKREWAIETGVIEGLYSLDRGVTQLLIERGIEASLIPHDATNKPVDEVIAIVRDQRSALELVFDFVANRRNLSTSYIKEIHALLTLHQPTVVGIDQFGNRVETPMIHGDYKKTPNNPTRDGTKHEYCPVEHVAAEMDRLIALHGEHLEKKVPPEVESAWLHHRFTQIHPFQDGNGRVARSLASLVLLRAEWFPLVINRDRRDTYISALEAADAEDLSVLVNLFVDVEKRALRKAVSIGEGLLQSADALDSVVASALSKLKNHVVSPAQRIERARFLSGSIEAYTLERLAERASEMSEKLKELDYSFAAYANRSSASTDRYYRAQIIALAKRLEYYADTSSYRAWVRLHIKTELMCDILFVFHALGSRPTGLMAISSFVQFRNRKAASEDEEEGHAFDGPHALCDEVFQFSYNENFEDVLKRFEPWFSKALLLGLDQWRRSL